VTIDVPTFGVWRQNVLCLSGSGYRAALFHLGALTRLNELGLLAQLETVGAVAGGSLLAALLAAQVPWPLQGAYREWPEFLAEPMRAIARRNARARVLFRGPLSSSAGEAGLEERYARQLAGSQPLAKAGQPRFVFGAAGLTLGEIAGDGDGDLRWEIRDSTEYGYDAVLVDDVIATVRTDLGAFGDAEQAVLENHGYLLVDATVRSRLPERVATIEPLPPEPPHPHWMNEIRAREALAGSSRRSRPLGRLRSRRARVDTRRRAIEWRAEESATLLERHRPIIRYDSLESYRADSVSSIVNLAMGQRCNSLHRANGALIAAAAPPNQGDVALLDLDFLGSATYANGLPVRDDDYLEESGGSQAADALAMRRRQNCADVVYGRACRDNEGRLWLQYWFFFYYNDKSFLNLGIHEGDWEMIQLRLDEDGQPQEATYGQHSGGARAAWDELERRQTGDWEAPVVYCARGSHACLFRAGAQAAPVVPDHNDGLGPMERPRLVLIGEDGMDWAGWPGRWGSTRRREAFEGVSPRGPSQQPRWLEPAAFHREARPDREVADLPGAAPPVPALHARREGVAAMVSYRFPAMTDGQGRPERIVAAPYRCGETEPPRTQTFKVDGEEGTFALQLPAHAEYEGVRLSVASELGVAGETLSTRFV
jgi:hypothetical protein